MIKTKLLEGRGMKGSATGRMFTEEERSQVEGLFKGRVPWDRGIKWPF